METVDPAVRRYLRTMPLHAVTEVFGESGLRIRFLLELDRLPATDRDRVTRALDTATEAHRDQRRVREPYLNHVLRVALRLVCYYEVTDADVVAAALLHDAVEDHAGRLAGPCGAGLDDEGQRRVAFAALREAFGPRVADLVAAVTNPLFDPDRDADEQYREHLATSLAAVPYARLIKLSDFTDNGVGVIHTTGPKLVRAATKYQPMLPLLRDLASRPDTPLSESARRHVLDQLDTAESRFRAILDEPEPEPDRPE